eukprot:667352-Amphidinium_carterae.1
MFIIKVSSTSHGLIPPPLLPPTTDTMEDLLVSGIHRKSNLRDTNMKVSKQEKKPLQRETGDRGRIGMGAGSSSVITWQAQDLSEGEKDLFNLAEC